MSITNAEHLKARIQELEAKSGVLENELKIQFSSTLESMKPGNLIKSAISQIPAGALIGNALKAAGGVGFGLLTSRISGAGMAASAGKKIIGGLLSQTATQALGNNMDKIKAYGTAILHNVINTKKKKV
jgi:hypothetical protein